MVRAYPAMTRLPAVVRPDRNSKGRIFYRFRVGTTSQAHSEVLCQRMQRVVRPDRNSKGRIFYRFRVGTTSQAHSEVLCQRMQRIRLSCAVIDLPGKAKVER